MPPAESERLRHMLEAAEDAASFVTNHSRANLDSDRMLRRALIQCLEEIGEAAAHVSPQTRASLPGVPWRNIRGMRNILAHAYFSIDLNVLWKTATEDVPALAAALRQSRPAWGHHQDT